MILHLTKHKYLTSGYLKRHIIVSNKETQQLLGVLVLF